MKTKTAVAWAAALVISALTSAYSQGRPPAPPTPRIFIFDNGVINNNDPAAYNFKRGELKELDLVNRSYLIVHPRGTLMFDSGAVTDSHFERESGTVTEGNMSATKALLPQLASVGYSPTDIDYFALSHYHQDHTANANAFASATWIVQKAERDFMFGGHPPGTYIAEDTVDALKNSKTEILNNTDFDVFGDGTVVVMSAPGHTPGHQVVAVKLAKRGTVLLGGDLYHYPEERKVDRVPTFEYDADQTRATRARIETFLRTNHAELWIEHDKVTHASLPLAPQYVE